MPFFVPQARAQHYHSSPRQLAPGSPSRNLRSDDIRPPGHQRSRMLASSHPALGLPKALAVALMTGKRISSYACAELLSPAIAPASGGFIGYALPLFLNFGTPSWPFLRFLSCAGSWASSCARLERSTRLQGECAGCRCRRGRDRERWATSSRPSSGRLPGGGRRQSAERPLF